MSSFQKRRTNPLLPGGKQSLHTGQQLVSTGNPALDHIFGGGLPIGSILLIEEDKIGRYASCLTKLFMAEGIVHKNGLFLTNFDNEPYDTIKKLPPMISEKSSSSSATSEPIPNAEIDQMRIAWRYNNLDKVDSEQGAGSHGNNLYTFDLSKSMDVNALENLDLTLFGLKDIQSSATNSKEVSIFFNSAYTLIIQKLQEKLSEPTFSSNIQSTNSSKKNLLRICIESFGSPIWYNDHFVDDICLFLTILKATVRMSMSVCCITMPTHLFKYIDRSLVHRIRNLVDYAIELESFAGSDKETNPCFKEYHGLFFIRKMTALNALTAHTPETYDLAFKLRRKRFIIEKLHLPPELQESEQREQDDEPLLSTLSCASTKKHLLEF